jgi:copper homeostasis protein
VSRNITFELSAETLQACLAAAQGGAQRVELCSALDEDGLTPSHALIRAAIEHTELPIHVILRPHPGSFHYTKDEFALIREDLLHARSLGAAGFAVGILHDDATIDIERTRELVGLAAPLEITFHRAFDLAPSLEQALEDVIAAGCHRVLTSGGQRTAVAGSTAITGLLAQARGRIVIAAGAGLRIENAADVARITGASHFHASMRRRAESKGKNVLQSLETNSFVDPEDIRALIHALGKA